MISAALRAAPASGQCCTGFSFLPLWICFFLSTVITCTASPPLLLPTSLISVPPHLLHSTSSFVRVCVCPVWVGGCAEEPELQIAVAYMHAAWGCVHLQQALAAACCCSRSHEYFISGESRQKRVTMNLLEGVGGRGLLNWEIWFLSPAYTLRLTPHVSLLLLFSYLSSPWQMGRFHDVISFSN